MKDVSAMENRYTKVEKLRLYSIKIEQKTKGKVVAFYIRNPDDNRVVAIFDMSMKLNPRYSNTTVAYDYGPIPELHDLTKQQADSLWENSLFQDSHQSSTTKTYGLCSTLEKSKSKNADFLIDAVFKNNKLFKYRVRCKSLRTAIQPWKFTLRASFSHHKKQSKRNHKYN